MLRTLYVRDYALIEEMEVAFDSGLNIITGETGAGKSILLGALSMILGERASMEAVRTGAKKAVVEGTFDESDTPALRALLEANGIEAGPALILRREISATSSRAFVNDSPATLPLIREVASNLIDLHGQHEHQSLLRTETHLGLVDSFGGLGGLVGAYRQEYERVAALVRERKALVARERELRQQKELYGFQIEEIDRVAPLPGEEDDLEAERRVLENAERLFEATNTLYEILYEGESTVHDQLVVVRNELQDLARIDKDFDEQLGEVRSTLISVAEVAKWLQDYNARVEFNPARLEEIRLRVGELELLKRKYGLTVDAVLDYRREIGETFELAANFEGAIAKLTEKTVAAQRALSSAALRLSAKRHEVAKRIEAGIVAELKALGIQHARFEVRFDRTADAHGWIRIDAADASAPEPDAPKPSGKANGKAAKAAASEDAGRREERFAAHPTGADTAEFYLTTNPGEVPRPLAKVASGGEVSRVMLALKTILAKSERMPILVFDEIDTGISGGVARKVGESMHSLAQYHQIVAITHLPQIAALGDVHFIVEKTVESGRTRTAMRRLTDDERADAVARLLAGEAVTDAALESARELMRK